MVCVYCGGATRVINSRPQQKSNQVWRRRRCEVCTAIFSTEEAAQYDRAWRVQRSAAPKSDTARAALEPFSALKLFLSLYRSCEHRKTALSDAKALTETVIGKLPAVMKDGTVTSTDITRTALVALNRFDKAASSHYQAFHKG